jgi:uncharacterized SAM-binding protein YcdF (DUF218 family)
MQLIMIVFAWIFWRRFKLLARISLAFAVITLLLLSLPVVSQALFIWLEAPFVKQATIEQQASGNVVVVLGGGRLRSAPEFDGRDQVSSHALWRLRYGAYLARKHVEKGVDQLPMIVSGGTVMPYETVSEAAMAAELLEKEFFIKRVIQEPNSRDTWQNAIKTAALLKQQNLPTVLLVTHAYHMRRAQYSFKNAGVDAIPMATGFVASRLLSGEEPWYGWWDSWLPSAYYLNQSRVALHEYLGLLFYLLR